MTAPSYLSGCEIFQGIADGDGSEVSFVLGYQPAKIEFYALGTDLTGNPTIVLIWLPLYETVSAATCLRFEPDTGVMDTAPGVQQHIQVTADASAGTWTVVTNAALAANEYYTMIVHRAV